MFCWSFSQRKQNIKATPPQEHNLIPLKAYYKLSFWRISWEATWEESVPLHRELSLEECWSQRGAGESAVSLAASVRNHMEAWGKGQNVIFDNVHIAKRAHKSPIGDLHVHLRWVNHWIIPNMRIKVQVAEYKHCSFSLLHFKSYYRRHSSHIKYILGYLRYSFCIFQKLSLVTTLYLSIVLDSLIYDQPFLFLTLRIKWSFFRLYAGYSVLRPGFLDANGKATAVESSCCKACKIASNLSGYGWGGGGGRELSLLFAFFLIKRQKTWEVVKEMFVLHLRCHDKLMIKTLHLLVKFLRIWDQSLFRKL